MAILKWLGGILVILLFLALALYAYLGGFRTIQIEKDAFGPAEIIFSTHVGPYPEMGESWRRFQAEWEDAGLDACNSLAVYIDPPGTPPEELRSILGCRIDALPETEKAELREQFPTFTLPRTQAYVAVFPYKNFLSFMFGPMKVYPALQKRLEEENVTPPVGIETYGVEGEIDEIGFIIPYGVGADVYQPLFEAF
ncbi:MAG: hypothetical protein AAFW68_07610 [Pseudomonadota bacterium]